MNIYMEIKQISRFFSVGIVAASVHLGSAFTLISLVNLTPMVANLIGFLLAIQVSFFGHYYWSFRSLVDKTLAYFKFFTTTGLAFLANNVLLVMLLDSALHQLMAVLLANLVIPCVTFVVSRFWIFKSSSYEH